MDAIIVALGQPSKGVITKEKKIFYVTKKKFLSRKEKRDQENIFSKDNPNADFA